MIATAFAGDAAEQRARARMLMRDDDDVIDLIDGGEFQDRGRSAGRCLRKLSEKIDWAMAALLALAFDLAVAHQAIEPRACLAIIGGTDKP
jgi:hypothetical protein